MLINVLQIILLAVCLSWLISWIKNHQLGILAAWFCAFLVSLELSAVYLTGQLIDYRFINHLSYDQISAFAFQFKFELLVFVGGWLVLGIILFLLAHMIRKLSVNKLIQATVILCCVLLMALPKGILPPLWNTYQITQANEQDLDTALNQLGIDPDEYIKPHQVSASAGKNIIVISLESIEQGFLKPPLNELTPNLSKLSKNWTYFNNMPPISGSDWTAGSLYTLQTGLPALFDQSHFNNNNLFQNSHTFRLTSLNHVLKKAGYETRYLIGKPEFGGMQSMLETIGMNVISEHNSLGTYPPAQPGLHDLDLFNEAKLQIKNLIGEPIKNPPFALFMSTINTHFPNGIMDERMLQQIEAKGSDLKTMISAVDYLVHDFIQFLDQHELFENTVVYIVPDHTLMGNTGELQKILRTNPRHLYLLSSADAADFKFPTEQEIHQTNLPQLILQGAGIQSNARFLNDFITAHDTADFIDENTVKIAAVNNAALKREQFNQGIQIKLENNNLKVTSQALQLEIPVKVMAPNEVYQVTFNADMVPLDQQQITLGEALNDDYIDPRLGLIYLDSFIRNSKLQHVILGNRFGVEFKKTDAPYQFSAEEINQLLQQIENQTTKFNSKTTATKKQYATDHQRFIAHAGGAIDGHKYTNSIEAMDHSYQQGFRLFELDIQQTADGAFVAVHDWPQWQRQTEFKGELPPNLETFLQQPILEHYTAMDMTAINSWFEQHPDAILVTDKVNKPADFVPQFIDSSRLMMELFTWRAVKQAKGMNLKAVLPTGDLVLTIPNNKITQLNNLGINKVAASRRWVDTHRHLIKQLNHSGIDVFAFHIGFDEGKDETHLVCHERAYFYGLYADVWQFVPPLNCQ